MDELNKVDESYKDESDEDQPSKVDEIVRRFRSLPPKEQEHFKLILQESVVRDLDKAIQDIYHTNIDKQEEAIINLLIKLPYIDMMKKVIDEFQFDVTCDDNTLIVHFASLGKDDVVRFLIRYGADARANDDYVFTQACEHGSFDLVKYLLELGVPANVNKGEALMSALCDCKILKLLLENGAMDNVAIDTINEALIDAVETGLPGSVKVLLDYGADPRVLDNLEYEADCTQSYVELAETLLSHNVPIKTIFRRMTMWNYR